MIYGINMSSVYPYLIEIYFFKDSSQSMYDLLYIFSD